MKIFSKLFLCLGLLIFVSCNSVENIQSRKEMYVSTTEIKGDKIDLFRVNDIVNLTNDEINMYKIDNLILGEYPKLIIDVNLRNGIADSFIINNIINGNLLLEIKNIGENTTINKKIPFLRLPINSTLKVNINYIEIDNTTFEIIEEEKGEYKFYLLNPIFLDEKTYMKKISEEIEEYTNIAFYNDNLLAEYLIKENIEGNIYIKQYSELFKGMYIEGVAENDALVKLKLPNGEIIKTKADKNGKWKTFVDSEVSNILINQEYFNKWHRKMITNEEKIELIKEADTNDNNTIK